MIRMFVQASTTVFIAVLAIALFGTWSYLTLPREASPDITIPYVMVSTPYIGVSPSDIEHLVTIPLENELASIRDVKKMESTSAEGFSLIALEFEPDVVIEEALQSVRDKVNRARPKLPTDVEESAVREISFSDIPVLIITIAGQVDEERLKILGEKLQDDIKRVDGVLDARLAGGLTREVRVQVDPARINRYGLSLRDVIGAIADENVNIPGGDVRTGAENVLIRTPGEFDSSHDIADVAVKRVGDRPVFVHDIAGVRDGFTERVSYARMNGEPAVSLSVTKRGGANIVDVAGAAKALVAEHAEAWPEGVEYRVLADQSVAIEDMVTELQNNILTALVLVVAVILFFMGFRNSFFVALAIPLSMLMSFAVLQALGFTLNMVVLFALILALGMLVDNAIVVVENIYRHIEMGKDRTTAAIDGTKEVAMAVAASTATTVAAFLPLVFWGGIMGQFMGYLPKTLIIVLVASLIVAIVILPVATSKLMKEHLVRTKAEIEADERAASRPPLVMRLYRGLLRSSIRFRYLSALTGVVLLFLTFGLYGAFNHGTEFFPDPEPNRAVVAVQAPDGTDLEATDRILRRIESVLAQYENVDVYVAESGIASGNALLGSSNAPNSGKITIDFLPHWTAAAPGEETRVEPTMETIERLRRAIKEIPGAEIEIDKEQMGPPLGAPIAIEVSGDDFHAVGELAQRVRRKILADVKGVTDLADDYRVGRPEMTLRIDRGAAKRIGVSSATIGDTIRTAVAGTKATGLRDGEDEWDVIVEVAPQYREDLQQVLSLRLPGRTDNSPDTFPVPLATVASYDLAGGTGSIKHIDQDMVVTIEGEVLDGFNVDATKAEVEKLINDYDTPEAMHLRLGGSNDEEAETQAFMMRAFVIALVLIAIVLVTQFDSIGVPVIILASVVLSLIGVLWGLLLTGTPFGVMMTGIGIISLAGVVVNNAIVLLDYVQQLLARGWSVQDALIEAGMTRFRPVMLTAMTTVLGLVPMAVGVSVDVENFRILYGSQSGQWWGPMAVAVIFGLGFATLLTLVMVPTLYSIYNDITNLPSRIASLVGLDRKSRSKAGSVAAGTAKVLLVGALAAGAATTARAETLEQIWAAAERHDPDLAMVREQTVQAEATRLKAWALVQPTITASGGYTLNQFETKLDFADSLPPEMADLIGDVEPTVVQPKDFWQGAVTVRQPLLNGSALPVLRGSRHLIDAARLDERRTTAMIRSGITRVVLSLATAREAVALADSSLALSERSAQLATRQIAAGLADDRAGLQSELTRSRSTRQRDAAREQLIAAEQAFSRITGLPPDTVLDLPERWDVPASLDQALELAERDRADLASTRERAGAASRQVLARKLEWMPTIDATFTYIFTQNTGFLDQSAYWTAGLNASWTLWNGGMRLANHKESASQLRATELSIVKLERQIREEVTNAWERHARVSSSVEAVEREVSLAQRNLELTRRSFAAGTATWLEVEQAELAVTSSELSLLNERIGVGLAAVDLQVAIGGYAAGQ